MTKAHDFYAAKQAAPKSWKPEVQTGSDPKWYGNALRFATREEAEKNAADLMGRWFAVEQWRVVESDDPVNYKWTDAGLVEVVRC